MTAPTVAPAAVLPVTREHVEALALAACDAAYSRALAVMTAPLTGRPDLGDDPKVQAARRDDRDARDALRAALDATFAELERLRAGAGR